MSSRPIKIYWDNNVVIVNSSTSTQFVDYLAERFETNYIENKEINETHTMINHDEYQLNKYFLFLFDYCKRVDNCLIKFVNNKSEAEITLLFVDSQTIVFENNKDGRIMKFGIEYDIPIPYLTGIYSIADKNNIYNYNNKRSYLLSYVGGSWRGLYNESGYSKRHITIEQFQEYSNNRKTEKYKQLFFCPILAKSHSEEGMLGWGAGNFGIKAKDAYWNSVYSWHPYGDTPTRRAFYEAILLGNIPIICKSSFDIYKNLLIGEENVQKIAIVLNDDVFYDAQFVFNHLYSISEHEIYKRRMCINNVYRRLQWNIETDQNILSDIIDKVLG